MKAKRLLKFYFSADRLDRLLNCAIAQAAKRAGLDMYGNCLNYAEKICKIIEAKNRLADVWARLDGVISAMTEGDRQTLKRYAVMRKSAAESEKKELHRTVVKFMRRAEKILADKEVFRLLAAYCCLLNPAPD